MLRSRRLWPLLFVLATLGGCTAVDDWVGLTRKKPVQAPVPTDGEIIVQLLDELNRLGSATPAQQAEIAEAARAQFISQPTPPHKLHYALVLATPGHGRTDLAGARLLLGEILGHPELLTPAQRSLAGIVYGDLNNLLALQAELDEAKAAAKTADKERAAAASRRIEALNMDNARLRKELGDANAKLEAVAELEKSLVDRHVVPEGPK